MNKPLTYILLAASLPLSTQAELIGRPEAIAASVVSLLVWNPMQLDGLGLDYGKDEQFERTRMLWLWDMKDTIAQFGPITLAGHYEFAFGQTTPSPNDVNIGITPVLQWQVRNNDWTALIETGLGAYYFTNTEHHGRNISTHFQFGEILGVAGRYKNIEFGLRYQHNSNGDIVAPNNGYNFYGWQMKVWY